MKLFLAADGSLVEFDEFNTSIKCIEFHLISGKWVTIRVNDENKASQALYRSIAWAGGLGHSAIVIDAKKLKDEDYCYVTSNA